MIASNGDTLSSRQPGSDLARVDAYQNTAEDYEEVPEVTAEQFARALPHRGGKPLGGRSPLSAKPEKARGSRLDTELDERSAPSSL